MGPLDLLRDWVLMVWLLKWPLLVIVVGAVAVGLWLFPQQMGALGDKIGLWKREERLASQAEYQRIYEEAQAQKRQKGGPTPP